MRLRTRRNRILVSLALAILLILPLFYLHINSSPAIIHSQEGKASIYFAADRNRLLFPGECVVVQWDVQSIKEVYLNGRGVVGSGQQDLCLLSQTPTLDVTFQDNTSQQYQLPLERLYLNPIIGLLLILLVVILCMLTYGLLGAPGVIALLLVTLVGPWVRFLVNQNNNMIDHIYFAKVAVETSNFNALPPQFLYHVCVIALTRIFPSMTFENAGFIVVMAANIACGAAIYYFLRWMCGNPVLKLRNQLILALLALGLMLVAPISNLTDIFIRIHPTIPVQPISYQSPTITVLRPLAVLLFFTVVRGLSCESGSQFRDLIIFGLLSAVSVIAKPSYALAFLPALLLLLIYSSVRGIDGKRRALLIGAVIVPSVLVLIWQYQYLYGFQGTAVGFPRYAINGQRPKIMLAPLEYLTVWRGVAWWWLIPGYLSLLVFPITVYSAYYQEARRDPTLNLAWLTTLIGAACVYLLIEVPGQQNGNFAWTGEISLFILIITSVGFLIRQNAGLIFGGERQRLNWRLVVCALVLIAHIVSLFVAVF